MGACDGVVVESGETDTGRGAAGTEGRTSSSCSMSFLCVIGLRQSSTMMITLHVRAVEMTWRPRPFPSLAPSMIPGRSRSWILAPGGGGIRMVCDGRDVVRSDDNNEKDRSDDYVHYGADDEDGDDGGRDDDDMILLLLLLLILAMLVMMTTTMGGGGGGGGS